MCVFFVKMFINDTTILKKVRDVIDCQHKLHMHLVHLMFEEQDATLFPLTHQEKYRDSILSTKEHEELLNVSIKKSITFYNDFAYTCKYLPDLVYKNSVKVYMRLFKSSGKWYIGYTTKTSAYRRHYDDRLESVNLIERNIKGTKIIEHYKDSILLYDDVTIMTLAEVHDITTAKKLEEGLINHFTTTHVLPIELCLNTQHVQHTDH